MIDLKAAAKNPAYTLSAMLYGLQNPIETEDVRYELDMSTFGYVDDCVTVCYGCAATSTLEVITGRPAVEYMPLAQEVEGPFSGKWRASVFNINSNELRVFEDCIDYARGGIFSHLMKFFGYKYDDQYSDYNLDMDTDTWYEKVPTFETVIERMHKEYPDWEKFKTL